MRKTLTSAKYLTNRHRSLHSQPFTQHTRSALSKGSPGLAYIFLSK